MSFATYWDLSEKERAALTSEEVERYGDVELMSKGVLKVPEFLLELEPPAPALQKTLYYRVAQFSDVLFTKLDDAERFRELLPLKVGHKWIGNSYDNRVDYVEPTPTLAIDTIEACSADEVRNHQAALEKAGAAREANRKKRQEYDAAVKAQNDALSGLWEDWHRCRALGAEMQRIVDTFERYKAMTKGDEVIAARFLNKAFTCEQIDQAKAWFEIGIPYDAPDIAAPAAE